MSIHEELSTLIAVEDICSYLVSARKLIFFSSLIKKRQGQGLRSFWKQGVYSL